MPGIPAIPPPLAIWLIILRASRNRVTSWLTSLTWVPEPPAIRCRRDALSTFTSARSPESSTG